MKLIEQYRARQQELEAQIKTNPTLAGILELQELNYRINVLDSIRILSLSAPKTTDMQVLGCHYQLTSGYLQSLATEHKFGAAADEAAKKKRETATNTLNKVIADGCKRFKGFKADADDLYSKAIGEFVVTVLDVWIPYRETYFTIKPKAESGVEEKGATAATVDPEMSLEERYKLAVQTTCTLAKHKGKTLGQLLKEDPKFINWLATKYKGNNELIAAALTICEYSESSAA